MKKDTAQSNKPGLILVVDDEDRNLRVMEALLAPLEYGVVLAKDGKQALEKVKKFPPDVILLDVMMPGMNGFEVCRRLKQDASTSIIPVIMITSLIDHEDLITGIEAGATDFISKPVDLPVITLKIRNAITTKHLYDQVQEKFKRIKELESLKDSLMHMIIHDLRSPLTIMNGNLEFLRSTVIKKLDEEETDCFQDMIQAGQVMTMMVSSVLDINRLENDKFPLTSVKNNLNHLVQETLYQMRTLTKEIKIEFIPWEKNLTLFCDTEIIKRVIINIVGNAVKYTKSNERITLSVVQEKTFGKIYIADNGPGIPEEHQKKIFDKFGQADSKQEVVRTSYGLGLAFCRLAVESHGGKIGVETNNGRGSTFWFSLPIKDACE
jgi:K+-sensing histidine kinase KdpD